MLYVIITTCMLLFRKFYVKVTVVSRLIIYSTGLGFRRCSQLFMVTKGTKKNKDLKVELWNVL